MDLTSFEEELETQVPWLDGQLSLIRETSAVEMDTEVEVAAAGAAGAIIAACVIGVLLAIGLLFSLAVFLDCRTRKQQTESTNILRKRGRGHNFKIRKVDKNTDKSSFVNQMYPTSRDDAPCSSSIIVDVHQ